jgi:hypothetical protein
MTDISGMDPHEAEQFQNLVDSIEAEVEKESPKDLNHILTPESEEIQVIDEEPQHEDEEKKERNRQLYQKRKLANLYKEKSKLQEEARLLAEENMLLRQNQQEALLRAQTAGDAAMAHYQDGINLRMQQLKESFKKAKELEDDDSIMDINFELAKLASEAKDLSAYNMTRGVQQNPYPQGYEQPYYPQQYPQQYNNYASNPQVDLPDETMEWAKRNPWILEGHQEYDPEKTAEILDYSSLLAHNYRRQGRDDLVHSKQYYDELDNYARQNFGDEIPYVAPRSAPSQRPSPERSYNMEESFSQNVRAPIAPVRKSSSGNYSSNNQNNIKLTETEKTLMKEFGKYGVKPQDFIKEKMKQNARIKDAYARGDAISLQQYGML